MSDVLDFDEWRSILQQIYKAREESAVDQGWIENERLKERLRRAREAELPCDVEEVE